MKPVRLGIVGFGWFAELLLARVFSDIQGLEVVAVVDSSEARRARAEELGLFSADLIRDLGNSCDAVAVLTPHDTHRAIVEEAAGMGLHVFCEKAFAVNSDDCLAMISVCASAGVVLAVGHMQKHFPSHARAIDISRSGRYGEVVAFHVDGLHWCPVMPGWWRRSTSCGGLLYWTGIHDLDTLRALLGSEAVSAFAAAGPITDSYTEYEDSIAVTLRYQNGAVGTLHVAEHDPLRSFEESFEIAVLFERGSMRIRPLLGEVRHAGRRGQERSEVITESFGTFETMEEHAYRAEFAAFASAVSGASPLDGSHVDGLRCVETLEAIYRSLASDDVETVVQRKVAATWSVGRE